MTHRADVELVRRGLARSRKHAADLVAAGRVRAADTVVPKPSVPVASGATLTVAPDPADTGYVSRAGEKLAGVLDALATHVEGREPVGRIEGADCLDLGASTGGFTDVLLRRGARRVTALDVGHGQLVASLRADARVDVIEGFNVRGLTPDDLPAPPDLVVGDLSFISLRLVVPAVAAVVRTGTPVLLLVKPQFEVGRERLGSGGVVRDRALHVRSVVDVADAAARSGLVVRAVVPSPLPGPSGNREYFCWFERGSGLPDGADGVEDQVRTAGQAAASWEPDGSLPPVLSVAGAPAGGQR